MLLLLAFTSILEANSNNALYRCGVRRRIGVQLIERGWVAELGQWPWHVALFHVTNDGQSSYACGGTLLDQRHVLTSAHCVTKKNKKNIVPINSQNLKVHLGQYGLKDMTGVQQREVSEVHVHEEYSTNRNDIALLVLNSDVEYSDFVIPICLDNRVDPDLIGQRGSVTGWGFTENHEVSQRLRTAQMPVVSHVECVQADPTLFGRYLDRGMFCAGERNGTSVCNGDSGGGFYISEGDRWVLKGVISFSGIDSLKHCDTMQYAGFANVQNYLSWIRNLIGTNGIPADRLKVPNRRSEIGCPPLRPIWCMVRVFSRRFVLTACSCMKDRNPVSARVGQFQNIKIANIFCHPEHNGFENDLALIKLKKEVQLEASVLPACLANNWNENLYDTLFLTGFKRGSSTNFTEFVESVDNLIITKEECRNRTAENEKTNQLTDSQLCVYSPGKEIIHEYSTNGLSGGALQTYNSRSCMYSILGICSDSHSTEHITIYSRIARILDWIEPIVWGDDDLTDSEDKKVPLPAFKDLTKDRRPWDCSFQYDKNTIPLSPVRKNTVVVDINKYFRKADDDMIHDLYKEQIYLWLNKPGMVSVQYHTLRRVLLIEMSNAEQAEEFAKVHNMRHTFTARNTTLQIPVYMDGQGITRVEISDMAPQESKLCIINFLEPSFAILAGLIEEEISNGILEGIPTGKLFINVRLHKHVPHRVLINDDVVTFWYPGQLSHELMRSLQEDD